MMNVERVCLGLTAFLLTTQMVFEVGVERNADDHTPT
jgi:hypothetical protein